MLLEGLIGLIKMDDNIIDTAFDILSLEALFLVPRSVPSILCKDKRTVDALLVYALC